MRRVNTAAQLQLILLLVASAIVPAFGQTARSIETSAVSKYEQIVREYREAKVRLNDQLSEAERFQVGSKLRDLRFRAQEIHFNLEITRGTSAELRERFRLLQESLTSDIEALKTARTTPANDRPGDNDPTLYDKLEDLAALTEPDDPAATSKALDQMIDRLAASANSDSDAAKLSAGLALERERLSLNTSGLAANIKRAASPPASADNNLALKQARILLVEQASHYLLPFNQSNITAKDAAKILEIAKYNAQVYDDIADPRLTGGSTSNVTRYVRRAAGIAKLADSVADPEARKILSGLRDTLGTLETRINALDARFQSPMKAFEIPAEVAAAIIDNSRKGMDLTSGALEDIGKAIAGDQAALGRLPSQAEKIEATLSPQAYGRAMAEAMGSRLLDKIPFLRALVKWSGGSTERNPASNAASEPALPVASDPSRTGGSDPNHRLSRVIGVWHIKIQGRPDEPNLPLEGHIVIPGKGYTWNIFRDPTWSNSVDAPSMKLSGSRFTMTAPWFWTGDRVFLQLSSDGRQMHGLWFSSFHDADKNRFRATLTRVYPRVTSQRVIRTGKNSITLEYTGTALPIDDRIHGRGMVEFSSPGMYLSDWQKDAASGAMKIMITHDDGVQRGMRTIWLNGVAYDWMFQ